MTIHPQDVHKLRAQIAGWLAVEPNRHIADSIDVPFFIDANGRRPAELVAVPVPAPADGLKTPSQAARRLGVSIRTLRGLVSGGELRYVNVGRGKQRERIMFSDSDLDGFIAERSRQKAQQCLFTSQKARRSTTSTSNAKVLAFTARRNGQTGGKRKR